MKRKSIIILLTFVYSLFFVSPVFAEHDQIEDELVYKIIVDRFNNIDHSIDERVDLDDPYAYQGGDLKGVKDKLDDLVTLGVSTITLSPLMQNADKGYHGYWVEDFTQLQDSFGTMEDLEELIEAAHAYDIKIVLEFVTNYVHEEHPIALESDKSDWILTDDVTGPAWTEEVVQLNQENPEVQQLITDAALYWLAETDIDGFMFHAVDQSSPDFIDDLATTLKEAKTGIYVLGNVVDPDADVMAMYQDTTLDAIDNYQVSQAIADIFNDVNQSPEELFELSKRAEENKSLIFVDDPYSKRFTQKFAENQRNTLTTWTLALTYMYTTPGTPMLLQGSEVSMYGEDAEDSQRLVPFFSGEPEVKEFYERLASLKDQFPALRHGEFEFIGAKDSMIVYKRETDSETFYIAINNGSESSYVDVPNIESGMMLRGYLADNIARENEEGNYRIGIPRESVEVYELTDDTGLNWGFIALVAAILLGFVVFIILLTRKQKKREAANK